MEALDNPKTLVFERAGVASNGSHVQKIKAAWANVWRGKARDAFFAGIPFQMVADYRAKKRPGGMMPGVRPGRAAKPK